MTRPTFARGWTRRRVLRSFMAGRSLSALAIFALNASDYAAAKLRLEQIIRETLLELAKP